MDIKNSEEIIKQFKEIEPGQCFYEGGNYYIKLRTVGYGTAVNLKNGEITSYKDDEYVIISHGIVIVA